MNKLLIIAILLIPLFAGKENMNQNTSSERSKQGLLVDAIRVKLLEKYIKKYNLRLSGIVDSAFGGVWSEVGMFLDIRKVISKQLARKIVVELVEDFIREINSNEELKPYLKEYPFTPKNIYVSLFIFKPDRAETYFPDLAVVNSHLGKVNFNTNDPKNPYNYKTEEEESFEEALEKVKTETPPEEVL